MSTKKFSLDKIAFGKKVKKIRDSKDYTLHKFGKIIGASPGFISEVETGKKAPGAEFTYSLLRNMGVDLNALFDNDPESDKKLLLEDEIGPYRSENGKETEGTRYLLRLIKEKASFVESLQRQVDEMREDKKMLRSMLEKQDEQILELKKQLYSKEESNSST